MRIPIISDHIEGKRIKAEKRLEKFRDFYKKENNPSSKYEKERKIVYISVPKIFGKGENPIRTLRKIKKRWYKAHGYSYQNWIYRIKEINDFQKLSQEERIKRANEQIKEQIKRDKRRRLESILSQWVENAEPIFEEIIEQNPEQMMGFEYYDHYSGGGYGEGAIYKRIVKKDKKLPVHFEGICQGKKFYTQSSSDYGEHNWIEETSAKEIASKILKQVVPDPSNKGVVYLPEWVSDENQIPKNEIKVIDFSKGTNKSKAGWLAPHRETSVLVKKRNQIVKDIEKRTGRNLKKEVSASRNKE